LLQYALMRYIPVFAVLIFIPLAAFFLLRDIKQPQVTTTAPQLSEKKPTPTPILGPIPERSLIENDYHIFQSFNNCGPAALSMALSYYGIRASQAELGRTLRPYQIPGGDNDDKSVTLEELSEKANEYGLLPYHRPAGTTETIQRFLATGIPVITRTLLQEDDDIGHFRVIKGYDDQTNEFIQDDSLQGKNLRFSYDDYRALWKPYNYEYLVLVPKEKQAIAEKILGENLDETKAWEHALILAREEQKRSDSFYPVLNESIALYHLGRYEEATGRFEAVESRLPIRTLWYQIEPILAYQKLKNYDRVFAITSGILTNQNRAFSELYYIRGQILEEQGRQFDAKNEYEKALLYKANFQPAISELAKINS